MLVLWMPMGNFKDIWPFFGRCLWSFSQPASEKTFCGTNTSRNRQSSEVCESGTGRLEALRGAGVVIFETFPPLRNCSVIRSHSIEVSEFHKEKSISESNRDLLEDSFWQSGRHRWFDWLFVGERVLQIGKLQSGDHRIWCYWSCNKDRRSIEI